MCIIISKDAGVKALDPAYFDRAWDANSHGGGLVWKKKGEDVFFQKGFMNKQQFLNKINEVNEEDTAFIAHFRIKSVGEVKPENCHPFVMQKVTFAHNGTLHIDPMEGKTDSETFGLAFLYDKDMSWIKEYKTLLEMALGTSKFAIMDNTTGEILILNKDCGKERDGAWFSNDSAFEKEPVHTYPRSTRWWEDNDYCTTAPYKGPQYLPNKNLGTKNFKSTGASSYKKDKGCFVYDYSGVVQRPYAYKAPMAIGKTGLWQFDRSITPSDKFANKMYTKDSRELKVINLWQKDINKKLDEYRRSKFDSITDRDEAEQDIHALHTLVNCMRRIVAAGKELTGDTLYDFCVANIERETWGQKYDTAFMEYIFIYAEDIIATLDCAGKTPAEVVNDACAQDSQESGKVIQLPNLG